MEAEGREKTTSNILLEETSTINVKTLNAAFAALLENDYQTAVSGKKMPGIWEQKWYNDQDNTSLHYGLGDVVWLNTESIDDIVRNRADDLYAYSAGNSLLRKQLDELRQNDDMSGYYAKLKQFALGQVDKRKGPIYWLGDLTKPAQIKISTKADNTAFPDDSSSWVDFIWSSSIEDVQLSIKLFHEDQTTAQLSSHCDDYHLANAAMSKQDIVDTYLLKDFSNMPLSAMQKFNSHYWYEPTMNGFDHVRAYQQKKSTNGLVKWFMLWNSGYLEHGGIIDIMNPVEGDTYASNSKTYTINLSWTYNNNKLSPIYDYPSEGLIQFYGREQWYESGNVQSSMPESYIGRNYRYDVTVTPVCSKSTPYSVLSDGKYDSIDVCFMNNGSFSFTLPNTNCTKFCYSVRGYTMKGVSQ